MIDDETRGALKRAASDMLLVGDKVAALSREERFLLIGEIAKAARPGGSRQNLIDLSYLLRVAWGDALWHRD